MKVCNKLCYNAFNFLNKIRENIIKKYDVPKVTKYKKSIIK